MTITTHRPRIVVTNLAHQEALDRLRAFAEVDANGTPEPWSRAELLRRCHDADGLMTFMPDHVNASFLDACPSLRIIACALKGADNFDLGACRARGVAVSLVPDLLTAPTAELTIGLMVALGRHLLAGDALVRSGRFQGWRPTLYGTGLDGTAVCIVGMGAVGRAVARRLGGFGCRMTYVDERPLEAEEEATLGLHRAVLPGILSESDWVVLTAPLTPRSHHLVGREALARMRRGALLVNPARGSLVDEAAVADALESGWLGGYAADVFEMEDWALPGRPDGVEPRLLRHPRTVLTPHLGSAVDAVRRDIVLYAARELECFFAGQAMAGTVVAAT